MPHLPTHWNGTQMNADYQDLIKKTKEIVGRGVNLRISAKICVLLKIKEGK